MGLEVRHAGLRGQVHADQNCSFRSIFCAWLQDDFNKAAEEVKQLPSATDDEKLALYGLFKQGTVGDNTSARPGMLDFKVRAALHTCSYLESTLTSTG